MIIFLIGFPNEYWLATRGTVAVIATSYSAGKKIHVSTNCVNTKSKVQVYKPLLIT